MLTNTLNTNEVRNAAGTEVEFSRLSVNERSTVFCQVAESFATPHRLSINHQETGVGLKRRRRSNNRVDKTVISTVDNETPCTISFYLVGDIPVGALISQTEVANVLAELLSFVGTSGSSTLLYDGTGTGASTLLSGGL